MPRKRHRKKRVSWSLPPGLRRVLLFPFDFLFLSLDTLAAVVVCLRRTVRRLFTRRPSHGCWFRRRSGYYYYSYSYTRTSSCGAARKYANLFMFRLLCPCVKPGGVANTSPACGTGKDGPYPHAIGLRQLILIVVLSAVWGGIGYGAYYSASRLVSRVRVRRTAAAQRLAAAARPPVHTPRALAELEADLAPELAGILGQARDYFSAGNFSAAIIEYRNAIKRDPANAIAHYGKGMCFLHQGELLAARGAMEHCARQESPPLEVFFDLARVQMALHHPEEAVQHAEKLKGTELDGVDTRLLLASGFQQLGAHSNGMVEAQHALSLNPTNVNAMLRVASLHVSLKENEQARERFLAVRELNPGAMDALVGLAILCRHEGELKTAMGYVDEALEREPESIAARVQSAEIHASTGAVETAVSAYRTLVEDNPIVRPIRLRLAELLLRQGRRDEALKEATSLLSLKATAAGAHVVAARAYAEGGFHSKAILHCEEALDRQQNAAAYLLLANAYGVKGDLNAALRTAEMGLSMAPGDLALSLVRAQLLARMNQWPQVEKTLLIAAEHNPTSPMPLVRLAEVRLREKRVPDAIAFYERALERDPEHVLAANNLAVLLLREDGKANAARALEVIEKLHEIHPGDPRVADTYGWACANAGKVDEAVAALSFAIRMMPLKPGVHYHLGAALLMKGDVRQAQMELEAALSCKGEFAEAEDARALLAEIKAREPKDG